ncbi:HNH endonuclease [Variovorax sp. RT4R15]|uniref:HNH endonuclease n=1 Tax=Variovorax sp. RT4R15 TaxID=3443737 RepID=UPI003F454653
MENKYGLSRTIPAEVARAVRQRDGFGCVICGNALIDYDHVDTEFADAREHTVDGIVLLCPQHHAEKTRKMLGLARLLQAKSAPAAKQSGFSFAGWDPSLTPPTIVMGGATFIRTPAPLILEGVRPLVVAPPEEAGGPYQLSARFFNSTGLPTLSIVRNEIRAHSNWDVELVGGVMTVREGPRKTALEVQFLPGEGIRVTKMNMLVRGYRVIGNGDVFSVTTPGGGVTTLQNIVISDCSEAGMSFGVQRVY